MAVEEVKGVREVTVDMEEVLPLEFTLTIASVLLLTAPSNVVLPEKEERVLQEVTGVVPNM